jgi:hypothetical protein
MGLGRRHAGWLAWLILAYVLCLIPSGWIRALTALFLPGGLGGSGSSEWLEWAAHAILIGGVAYHLMRLLQRRHTTPVDRLMNDELMGAEPQTGNREPGTKNRKPESSRKTEHLKLKTSAMLQTLAAVALIAASIEVLQGMLPEWFRRGFAWSDIVASVLGGWVGAALACLR